MAKEIRFQVNGAQVALDVDPATSLLLVLRNELGLRGTRHGCAEGHCGACTVLVDDRAVTSCNTPLEAVADRAVETVESLADAEPRHPLVAALLAEQAGQCGYCLAGILMRAKGLLADTPRPRRREIAQALDGNLCRCGAHNRILRAIARASEALAPEASR